MATAQQQLPESQFVNSLLEISVINTIWISLLSRYSMLKGRFWVVDEVLKNAEKTAFWVEQKAENVATSYKLDNYLKKIDTAASNVVTKVEDTRQKFMKRGKNE